MFVSYLIWNELNISYKITREHIPINVQYNEFLRLLNSARTSRFEPMLG